MSNLRLSIFRRQFREIRFSHSTGVAGHTLPGPGDEHPTTSNSADEALRGRLYERAEHEALNNMIMSTSVTGELEIEPPENVLLVAKSNRICCFPVLGGAFSGLRFLIFIHYLHFKSRL